MKNTPHIQQLSRRHASEACITCGDRAFPQTEHHYRTSQLQGSCGTPAQFHRPAFFEISSRYFAEEEARGFAVDAAVFAALIGTALLPIVNGVLAVATLIHTGGTF
ncbi:MAG TPA: hypothetical protein VGI60_14370 [Chthoniobacterales bacterium]|jgi:hypothetical protein